jgi:hypothetical protein
VGNKISLKQCKGLGLRLNGRQGILIYEEPQFMLHPMENEEHMICLNHSTKGSNNCIL